MRRTLSSTRGRNNPRAIVFGERRDFAERGDKEFRLGDDVQRDLVMARPVADSTPRITHTEVVRLERRRHA